MGKLSNERLRILALLGGAVIIFIILAAGLSSVKPRAGEIIFAPRGDRLSDPAAPRESSVTSYEIERGNPLIYLAVVAIVAIAIYSAFRSRKIRYGLLTLLVFTAIVLGATALYRRFYEPPEEEIEDFGEVFAEAPERIPQELLDNPPAWLDTVSILVTIGILLIIVFVVWVVLQMRQKSKAPLEIVAFEAETALANIRAGVNIKDAVTRCYFDMNRSVARSVGVVRQEGMTPREFEDVLVKEGLPRQSVERLTRLFERIRYGGQEASERDKREAVDALQDIVDMIRDEENQAELAASMSV